MHTRLFLRICLVAPFAAVLLTGCNDRRGRTGPPPDGSIRLDGGTTDPRCPGSPPFTFMTCGESQSGAVCTGMVSCACGSLPTACTCQPGEVGYAFQCTDDCSACSAPDGGVRDSGGGGGGDCGAVYDRLSTYTPCPLPATVTRDQFLSQCAMIRAVSAMCASQLDAELACSRTAPIECTDIGGMVVPLPVDCPPVDAMCIESP